MPLQYIRADITKVQTDAIVNAANPTLLGGGGVDGAIHKAAGPGLLDECKKLGGCSAGEAKITKGYDLPCKYVIHTVGPVWRGGWHGEEKQLRACYRNSLELAEANGCESLAFPLISAGAYGYPKDKALKVATEAIQAFLNDHEMNVTLVVFAKEEFEISSKLYRSVKSFIDDEYAEARNLRNRISQIYAARQDDEFWNPGAAVDDAPEAETLPDAIMPKYQVAEKKSKAYQPSARKSEQPCESFFGNAVYDESMAGSLMDPLIPDDLKRIMEIQDEGFKGMLIRKIGETGMTDAQCYKKANIDRRHFNHLINDSAPKPKKRTVLAFALALRLNRDEAEELLKKAGFAFSPADKTDKIIQYCIRIGAYDINEINQILFAYDLQPLGC